MNGIIQAIGTGATVSAVVLALWLQVLRERVRRPRLDVRLNPNPEEDEDIVILEGEGYIEYYLRVKVKAAPKRNSARGVQALLLRVERPNQPSLSTLRVPDTLLKWSGPSYAETVDIAPGTWRRLDVLRYQREDSNKELILAPVLNRPGNTTEWPPSRRSRLEDPGAYKLDFVVSCEGAEPSFWRLLFEFRPTVNEVDGPADLIGHFVNIKLEQGPTPAK